MLATWVGDAQLLRLAAESSELCSAQELRGKLRHTIGAQKEGQNPLMVANGHDTIPFSCL